MKIAYCSVLIITVLISCISSNKRELKYNDYRLFNGTVVEELATALQANDSSLVDQILLNKAKHINYQEPKLGSTLLMLTVRNNQLNMCRKLLENGADPAIHDSINGSSAIIDACASPYIDVEILQLLLSKGANPNDVEVGARKYGNTRRDTPLIAATTNSIKKVKILIGAGAQINHMDEFGVTALITAYMLDRLEITLYLLKNGADYTVPFVDRDGKILYLIDMLRELTLPLDSEDYQLKMQIVDFLSTKGLDYRKVPIPQFIIEEVQKRYPTQWEEYLKKY